MEEIIALEKLVSRIEYGDITRDEILRRIADVIILLDERVNDN